MEKIEKLLQKGNGVNLDNYNRIKKAGKEGHLAVFWGAGLSLGGPNSHKWETPFRLMLDGLREKNINQFRTADITDNLNAAEMAIHNNDYPLAGNYLDRAYAKLYEMYDSAGRGPEFFNGKSFNQFLIEKFDFGKYPDVTNANLDSPYSIPALFFIPFIGKRRLTTNIDSSYDKVLEKLGIDGVTYPVSWDDSLDKLYRIDNKAFQIHGSIDYPESLVFTASQYKKVYPTETGATSGPKELLKDTVRNFTILFLGASLQQDSTVSIINEEIRKKIEETLNNPEIRDKYFCVPVIASHFNSVRNCDEVDNRTSLLRNYPILFSTNSFGEISLLLLQLIRETAPDWIGCRWGIPDEININHDPLDDNAISELNGFLNSNDPYLVKHFDAHDAESIIAQLANHHSIEKHDAEAGWSICEVLGSDFSLKGGKDKLPILHNYPLGDTVYIIAPQQKKGKPVLFADDAETIEEEIRTWRESLSDSPISPRVRVIVFPLPKMPLSYKEKQDLSQDLSKSKENLIDGLSIFIDGITEQISSAIQDDSELQIVLQSYFPEERIRELILAIIRYAMSKDREALKQTIHDFFLPFVEVDAKGLVRGITREPDKYMQRN